MRLERLTCSVDELWEKLERYQGENFFHGSLLIFLG